MPSIHSSSAPPILNVDDEDESESEVDDVDSDNCYEVDAIGRHQELSSHSKDEDDDGDDNDDEQASTNNDQANAHEVEKLDIIDSNKGQPMLAFEGFLYHLERKKDLGDGKMKHFWRCELITAKDPKNRCYGRCTTIGLVGPVTLGASHDYYVHKPDPELCKARACERKMVNMGEETDTKPRKVLQFD